MRSHVLSIVLDTSPPPRRPPPIPSSLTQNALCCLSAYRLIWLVTLSFWAGYVMKDAHFITSGRGLGTWAIAPHMNHVRVWAYKKRKRTQPSVVISEHRNISRLIWNKKWQMFFWYWCIWFYNTHIQASLLHMQSSTAVHRIAVITGLEKNQFIINLKLKNTPVFIQ